MLFFLFLVNPLAVVFFICQRRICFHTNNSCGLIVAAALAKPATIVRVKKGDELAIKNTKASG